MSKKISISLTPKVCSFYINLSKINLNNFYYFLKYTEKLGFNFLSNGSSTHKNGIDFLRERINKIDISKKLNEKYFISYIGPNFSTFLNSQINNYYHNGVKGCEELNNSYGFFLLNLEGSENMEFDNSIYNFEDDLKLIIKQLHKIRYE